MIDWLLAIPATLIVARLLFARSLLRRGIGYTQPFDPNSRIRYRASNRMFRSRASTVTVAVKVPKGFLFRIRRERIVDKLAKWMHLSREFQTGQRDLDGAVYFMGDDHAVAARISGTPTLEKAVLELVRRAKDETLHCSGGYLWVCIGAAHDADALTNDHLLRSIVDPVTPLLESIRAAMVRGAIGDSTSEHRARLVATSTWFGILGIGAYVWNKVGPTSVQLFDDRFNWLAAMLTACVVAVPAVRMWRIVGVSSYAHLLLVELICVGIAGAWLTSRSISTGINRWLDTSQVRVYVTEFERVSQPSNSRRLIRFKRRLGEGVSDAVLYPFQERRIRLQRWPANSPLDSLGFHARLYSDLKEGNCVQVSWCEGALGVPWISHMRRSYKPCE